MPFNINTEAGKKTDQLIGMALEAQRNHQKMIIASAIAAPKATRDEFNKDAFAFAKRYFPVEQGRGLANFIAASIALPIEAASDAYEQDRVASSLGAPVDAKPMHTGMVRNFLDIKFLAADETPEVDTDSNSYEAITIGKNGDARRHLSEYGRTAYSTYEIRTDNEAINDVEISRNPWNARARVIEKTVEALAKKEDTYFLEGVRTAALDTNGTSDDQYVSRSAAAMTESDYLALTVTQRANGGTKNVLVGVNRLYDIIKWGISGSSNTLFTPETREANFRRGIVGGMLDGANIVYKDFVDTESSGSYANYVYGLLEPARVGKLVVRPIEGMAVKTYATFDMIGGDNYLFAQKESVLIIITNIYGCAVSYPA